MLNLSKKLFGLAGAVTMFTGMVYGQTPTATCSALAPTTVNFIRAEGQTEQLSNLVLTCNGTNLTAATGASVTVTVYLTPTVAITNPIVTSSTGATSATATSSAVIAMGGSATAPGIVNAGSSLVFSNLSVGASGAFTITLNNIRVNATQIPTTAGAAPTAIAAQAFISGTNVTPGNTGSAGTVAFVSNGITASKFASTATSGDSKINNQSQTPGSSVNAVTSFGVCGSLNNSTGNSAIPNFFVSVAEGFQFAFKTQASEGADATTGTRIKFVFGNIPAGLNIYMPVTLTTGSTIVATTSETGAFVAQTPVNTPAQLSTNLTAAATASGGVFQVSVSNGTASAIYEVRADGAGGTLDTFSVPVYLQSGSNAVTSQSAALTLQTSLAPVAPVTTVPSFAVLASSSPTLNIVNFTQCTTSLLFPFVTNVAGFETGIAIDNTSKDPFGTRNQSGSCTLSFYGTSATSPTSGPAPNPNEGGTAPYLAGESYAFTLTAALQAASSTNPATFQGYMIANCNYQFAHGFAYITYGFPGTSSSTMGYLATVLTRSGSSTSAEVTYQPTHRVVGNFGERQCVSCSRCWPWASSSRASPLPPRK